MGNPEKPALRDIFAFEKMLMGSGLKGMKESKIGGILSKRGALRKWHLKPPS